MRSTPAFDEDFFGIDEASRRTYSPAQRRMTRRHTQLIAGAWGVGDWSARALHACLQRLAVSTLSEAWCVGVVDAWVDGGSAFCVVYRYRDAPTTIGLRSTADEDLHVAAAVEREEFGPEQFGRWVADFDIGEPLGSVARGLRTDEHGIGWWGALERTLPRPPAPQGRHSV